MANVMTATVETAYAHVRLRMEFTLATNLTATVERSTDGGVTWQLVRGGNPVDLVGPAPGAGNRIAYLFDTEMPLNTSVLYRATSNVPVVITAGPVTVTETTGSWLKDPARPWANVRMDDCVGTAVPTKCSTPLSEPAVSLVADGLATEGYEADATLFPILNRARPADVYGYRKDAVTAFRSISKTRASQDTLNVFYAWGGPVFLQLPVVYGWPDRYYQPGRVDVSRVSKDLRIPYRLWEVPLTVVDAPVGAAQGTFQNNWCVIKSIYTTWTDLTSTGFTWGQIMQGQAGPPPVGGYGYGGYGDGPYGG